VKPIRVLVVDDSATVRSALVALLYEDPDVQVVGEAQDGVRAVELARTLRPDVITMDVLMPRLDGLGATAAIMAETPSRVLVVCTVAEDRQLDLSFRAMAAGALELISKPPGGGAGALRAWGQKLREAIHLMAEVPVVGRKPKPAAAPHHEPELVGEVDAFGLVASTGGPPALAICLAQLPPDLRVPLFIAQHIAEGFTAGLLRWLGSVSRLPVALAETGMVPRPGRVYLPPDGHDLAIGGGTLHVTRSAGVHSPSGDLLLSSLAAAYGSRAGGVVLTGMGDDGARGLSAIHAAGGVTLAQDEQSSVVFGMPQASHALCPGTALVPLESLADLITDLSRRPRARPAPA
jgi:two-component system chemotaxis response regulator CheB